MYFKLLVPFMYKVNAENQIRLCKTKRKNRVEIMYYYDYEWINQVTDKPLLQRNNAHRHINRKRRNIMKYDNIYVYIHRVRQKKGVQF